MGKTTVLTGVGEAMWQAGQVVPETTGGPLHIEVTLSRQFTEVDSLLKLWDRRYPGVSYDRDDVEWREISIDKNGTIWPFGTDIHALVDDIDSFTKTCDMGDLLAFSLLPLKLVLALVELERMGKILETIIHAPHLNPDNSLWIVLEVYEHEVGIDIKNTNNYLLSIIRKINTEMKEFDPREYEDTGVIIEDGELEDLGTEEDAETSPNENEELLEGMSVKRSTFNTY